MMEECVVGVRIKILVIMDISVLRFYRYIDGYFGKKIGMPKIAKNSWKCKKNLITI